MSNVVIFGELLAMAFAMSELFMVVACIISNKNPGGGTTTAERVFYLANLVMYLAVIVSAIGLRSRAYQRRNPFLLFFGFVLLFVVQNLATPIVIPERGELPHWDRNTPLQWIVFVVILCVASWVASKVLHFL